jgi:beta-glucosidase
MFHLPYHNNAEMPLQGLDLPYLAATNECAIIVLSRVAGEGEDMAYGPGTLALSEEETAIIDAVTAVFDKTVLVLNVPGFLEIAEASRKVSAVVFMGLAGQEGGHALCDVLTGAVSPSGKLTDTWPMAYSDYPSAADYGTLHGNGNVVTSMGQTVEQTNVPYADGIYVGYRYFDTFGTEVLYPFGYGLSYGAPVMTACAAGLDGNTVTVTAEITNQSETYPCRQVVQVYASQPQGTLEQPKQILVTYAKTKELAPGASETLHLSFPVTALASYDAQQAAYVLGAGYYDIRVGSSSRDTCVAGALFLKTPVVTQRLKNRLHGDELPFAELSNKDAVAWTYPGEADELTFARNHAIRVAERSLKTTSVKYRKAPTPCKPGRADVTLLDVKRGEATLEELVAALSDNALCRLACGVGMDLSGMPPMDEGAPPPFDGAVGPGGILGSVSLSVQGAAGETVDLREPYGIPPMVLADGPAGLRLRRDLKNEDDEIVAYQLCTAFPVGSLLACSWDTALAEQVGRAVGREMQEYHVDLWLAPGMNIHRNPLCGRNFEYYAEDPVVAGCTAAAITRGVQSVSGGVTIKHFAGNNQELQRTCSNDQVSERAFREIYLRGFEIAVRTAKPWAIMTSYNDINGVPAANNDGLCTALARDEWGFDGLIMTDWGGGISQPALSMWAGNDMLQPGGPGNVATLEEALASGEPVANRGIRPFSQTLTRAMLEQSALHILSVVLRTDTVRRMERDARLTAQAEAELAALDETAPMDID